MDWKDEQKLDRVGSNYRKRRSKQMSTFLLVRSRGEFTSLNSPGILKIVRKMKRNVCLCDDNKKDEM